MVKASLRQASSKVEVLTNAPVEVQGVVVESSTSVGVEETLFPTDTAPATAVAVRPPQAVARNGQFGDMTGSGFEGDFGADDLKFPQLKVVQGSGQLSTLFDTGTMIYADEEIFGPPSVKDGAVNPVIRFVPISIKKQWREKLDQAAQAAGEMPRVVNSIGEVEALGGTTRWINNEQPSWGPSARCLFLLELPESVEHPGFSLEMGGKAYAVAVYYAAGSSFNVSAKVLFNTALTSLLVPVTDKAGNVVKNDKGQVQKRPLLWKAFWTLQFAKKQVGQFQVWQPVIRLQAKDETSEEIRDYCKSLSSQSATELATAE